MFISIANCLKCKLCLIFFTLELDEDNPLWIGAWWMGFVIVGSIVLSLAPLMTLFPALIPPPKGTQTDAVAIRKQLGESAGPSTAKEWWADFFKIIKRLFTNRIYVLSIFSSAFMVLAIVGFAQFIPKYFEVVFRQRASESGLAAPMAKSAASITGVIIAGVVVGKWQPRARK